ncbi:MAG: antitoxin Xre/MbcA/ParS toxin-binding domain-containing protein [Bacteroidota bacterium]
MQVAQVLETSKKQSVDWIKLAREGVSKQFMQDVQARMQLSQKELADLLHLTPRTIQRMKNNDLLSASASGQLLELARLYRRAVEVLGDETIANQWLRTPVTALGSEQPISLLDTPIGIQWVMTILGRIEYGVYS